MINLSAAEAWLITLLSEHQPIANKEDLPLLNGFTASPATRGTKQEKPDDAFVIPRDENQCFKGNACSIIVIDCDSLAPDPKRKHHPEGLALDIQATADALFGRKLKFIAHTSYNHRSDFHKFRVVLFPDTPVPFDQYLQTLQAINTRILDGAIDPKTFSPHTTFYPPSCPPEALQPGAANAPIAIYHDGDYLDWRALLKEGSDAPEAESERDEEQPSPEQPSRRRAAANGSNAIEINNYEAWLLTAMKEKHATLSSLTDGRWQQATSDALRLSGIDALAVAAGWPSRKEEIAASLKRAVLQSYQATPGANNNKIEKDIEDAMRNGEARATSLQVTVAPPPTQRRPAKSEEPTDAKTPQGTAAVEAETKKFQRPRLDPTHLPDVIKALAGRICGATEVDPPAFVFQLLTEIGVMVGRRVYVNCGGAPHYMNLFTQIVGHSGLASKGTSRHAEKAIIRGLQSFGDKYEWDERNYLSGIVSGAGLIHEVRDKKTEKKDEDAEEKVIDAGVTDKRKLIVETEFSRMMKATAKPDDPLREVMQQLWDGDDVVSTRAKTMGEVGTQPHAGLIGHITPNLLTVRLPDEEIWSGSANRYLYVFSRSLRNIPDPPRLTPQWIGEKLLSALKAALDNTLRHPDPSNNPDAADITPLEITFDDDAAALWRAEYPALRRRLPTKFGELTGRAAPHVRVLAALCAICEGRRRVTTRNLQAGLALWKYSEDTIRYYFHISVADMLPESMLAEIREAGEAGVSLTKLSELARRNEKERDKAIKMLTEAGLIEQAEIATTGRPVTICRIKDGRDDEDLADLAAWRIDCAQAAKDAKQTLQDLARANRAAWGSDIVPDAETEPEPTETGDEEAAAFPAPPPPKSEPRLESGEAEVSPLPNAMPF
jgi:hypothetical protein